MRININLDDKPGGKLPIAYRIDRPFPFCSQFETPYYFRTYYDCKGLVIGARYFGRCMARIDGELVSVEIRGFGAPQLVDFKGYNFIQDMRSVEMMMRGCCPPAILSEFMGTGEIPG